MVIFSAYLLKNIPMKMNWPKKKRNLKKKIIIFGPPWDTHISASRALIKNRLDEASNLA